jgi:Uma2 family endonuclease
MSTVFTEPLTVAELLEQLGNIPAHRVRLRPPPGQATEADVLAVHDRENRLCELVGGVLVEKAMGYRESLIATMLCHLLWDFLGRHPLGVVAGADGTLRLAPGLVRIPDVSFISWERMPGRMVPRAAIPHLGPDLAVEILSASNTPAEMARKVAEYFDAGARLVWIIDPETRTATVYAPPQQSTIVTEDDTLDGGDVLPGFAAPLRALFGPLDEPGSARRPTP